MKGADRVPLLLDGFPCPCMKTTDESQWSFHADLVRKVLNPFALLDMR